MRRIKHHCCFRLEQGRRAGMMCREPLDGKIVGVRKLPGEPDVSDYCCRHALMVLDRWAKARQEAAV